MFGDVGGQAIAIAMPFVIVMFNSYSVVILSLFSESEGEEFTHSEIGLIKN